MKKEREISIAGCMLEGKKMLEEEAAERELLEILGGPWTQKWDSVRKERHGERLGGGLNYSKSVATAYQGVTGEKV